MQCCEYGPWAVNYDHKMFCRTSPSRAKMSYSFPAKNSLSFCVLRYHREVRGWHQNAQYNNSQHSNISPTLSLYCTQFNVGRFRMCFFKTGFLYYFSFISSCFTTELHCSPDSKCCIVVLLSVIQAPQNDRHVKCFIHKLNV